VPTSGKDDLFLEGRVIQSVQTGLDYVFLVNVSPKSIDVYYVEYSGSLEQPIVEGLVFTADY
jgi:hypothetical protein